MATLLSLPSRLREFCVFGAETGQRLIGRKVVTSEQLVPKRTVIYYNRATGNFRTNRAVTQRFYRLNWGAWIRPRAGRHKHLWQKPYWIKWWAKQHVFCSDEHNKMLDQMVDSYYKRPTYLSGPTGDDPYEPYHKRHNFAFVPLGRNSVSTSYINTLYEYKNDN
ncbi:39S ribosomal protein L35, mitochondrial-like [Oppia nitens]|uniref:39S ribosomal protein L35, mitochondrial-like n=1 Tax=Oppia nitens TaxID=1686743 RepID=UPI0023D9FF13|nr:39S ribosomal protein L35, mitochondrial-like [Oppia nitens]